MTRESMGRETGWVLFELDNGGWALPLEDVAEVAIADSVRRIPGAGAPVVGLAECRGRLFTLFDLARMLGGTAPAGPPALVLLTGVREPCALYLTASLRLGRSHSFADGFVEIEGRRFQAVDPSSLLAVPAGV